jgi:putative ABC transport system permease protein
VRQLGFAGRQAAIGKAVTLYGAHRPSQIVGVVGDFAFKSVRDPIDAAVDFFAPGQNSFINVRLTGRQIPETLAAIDRVWQQSGAQGPIMRIFLSDRLQSFYLDIIRQGQVFGGFAAMAVLIACLGLFGLAASTAEQRTKEIGIRKAMGAKTSDIMRLLLWQFAKPVLWANLIAWPVAGYLMWRWLRGFAYRIDLSPWLFLAASALALAIAMLTVLIHSWLIARARPVAALRYE